jgi:hypothetical protein
VGFLSSLGELAIPLPSRLCPMRHFSLALALLFATAASLRSQDCADTASVSARIFLQQARRFASSSEEPYASFRRSAMKVAAQLPQDVVFAVGDSLCQSAKAAYTSSVTPLTPHTVQVLVIAIGADYLVIDPLKKYGGNYVAHVFTSSWQSKAALHLGL